MRIFLRVDWFLVWIAVITGFPLGALKLFPVTSHDKLGRVESKISVAESHSVIHTFQIGLQNLAVTFGGFRRQVLVLFGFLEPLSTLFYTATGDGFWKLAMEHT